ncbi:MAG: hydroxyacid dehydrogenase [Bacteroidetes bacterium]|nr:MAG: hydroxyacid dehydrogenase [Bacteroidota bacterium]
MKILVIHKVHTVFAKLLTNAGYLVEEKLGLSRKEILDLLPNYDGLIVRSALKIDKEVIDIGCNLKLIGRLGAGMENIDSNYAISKNIKLLNAPEGNRSAVGEHTVGMLLSLFNNLNKADKEVRNGIWHREENRGEEIEGKTIGIIGYGNMGGAFARKISGFRANVIAYDKYKTNYSDNYVKEVNLEHLLKYADIISLHVPLQEDTFHMVNQRFINSCKNGVYIVNTARGAVIDTKELVIGIKNNKIKGACLDVLEYEGMSFEDINSNKINENFEFLTKAKNVILSPHIAGWTHQSNEKMAVVLAEKIIFSFNKNRLYL